MALHTPLWMQEALGDPDILFTGQELRQMLRSNLGIIAGNLDVQGVAGASSFAVTQRAAGANFSVDVAAGSAYVVGDDVSGQGTYFCWNDGTVNVATPTAPASGTRVHRLVLQIQDKLSNGTWTGYTAALTLLQDTGSGTPAEPNSALTLALISIAAGQASVLNANITDQRASVGDLLAIKPADQSVTSSTSLITDPDLFLPLGANATYLLDLVMLYSADTAGDIQMQLAGPAGASAAVGVSCLDTGATSTTGAALTSRIVALPTPALTAGGIGAGVGMPLRAFGMITTGAAAGLLLLKWAQGTSSGVATVLKASSYMKLHRVK